LSFDEWFMVAFGNQLRPSGGRRNKPTWLTLVVAIILSILGIRFTQEPPQAPPAPRAPSREPKPAPGPSAPQSAPHSSTAQEPVKVVRVVDGDTLLLERGIRVRFLGVNTPEIAHDNQPEEPLGQEANEFTRKFLEGKSVTLEYDQERVDDYGRTLAYVYADGRMLNEALIEAGLSEAVTRHPYRSDRKALFREAEKRAYAKRIGIWAQPGRRPR